jgi:cytochrome c-type protein NapB
MKHPNIEFTQFIGACLLLGGLALACATSLDEAAQPTTTAVGDSAPDSTPETTMPSQPAGIADHELGLSKTSVFDTPIPEPVMSNTTDPGDRTLIPRAYEISPPRIPHLVADFLPVTQGDNLCIDCHQLDAAEEGDPKPIPVSHFLDLRNAPEVEQDTVAGARYVCVACHLEQTDAQPLVQNLFQAAPAN